MSHASSRPLRPWFPLSVMAWACQLCTAAMAQTPPAAPAPAASAASAPAAVPAPAAKPAQQSLERVNVSGALDDSARRRTETASKIVFSRAELDRFGDTSVAEMLKRLPGVTLGGNPGRGGEIRMRGMGGGYTQILVDGEPMGRGFSMDSIPPEQIERIEIMRAPTAETGARAIAGTINIVLREDFRRRNNDLRLGLNAEQEELSPSLSWSRSGSLSPELAYNFSLNAMSGQTPDHSDSLTTGQSLNSGASTRWAATSDSLSSRDGVFLTGRLQWKLGGSDSLVIQPFLGAGQGSSTGTTTYTDLQPGTGLAPLYTLSNRQGNSHSGFGRLMANLQKKLDDDWTLVLRLGTGANESRSDSLATNSGGRTLVPNTVTDQSRASERSLSTSGKLSRWFGEAHNLVTGWDIEANHRDETSRHAETAFIQPEELYKASTRRLALYAQDEWTLSPQWSAYAGARWEQIVTDTSGSGYSDSRNTSSVFTPLFHVAWKPVAGSRDVIRSSLTRSYRSPQPNDLIPRLQVAAGYPLSGPVNEFGSPDRMGNPALKPELATGVELAYEHYLPQGGMVGVNVFYRHIDDLIRRVTSLQAVPGAATPRWVSSPQNVGTAKTLGIELEAKGRLGEVMPWLADPKLPLNLRANLSLFRSSVDQLPGPNNRLDQQPPYTLNLGGDYKFARLPLTVGLNVNYTPMYDLTATQNQSSELGLKRSLDVFALWVLNPNAQLRFTVNNWAPRGVDNASVYSQGGYVQSSRTTTRTAAVAGVKLELKL